MSRKLRLYFSSIEPYPVISIDDSYLKNFECLYGTGEAFLRSFENLTSEKVAGKKFLVFGFGKIGRGIHKHLSAHNAQTVVVDCDKQVVNLAKSKGVKAYHSDEKSAIKREVQNTFTIATATGQNRLLQNFFNANEIAHCYLANMGVEDEIVGEFLKVPKLLFDGKAINFSLSDPTQMKFLDPVFYAHNLVGELLVKEDYTPGYHPLDFQTDLSVIREWESAYGEKTQGILPSNLEDEMAS